MIANNTPPTTPANPAWLWYLISLIDFGGGSIVPATMMLGYLPTADPSPGDDPETYLDALSTRWENGLSHWLSTTTYWDECGFYWMTSRGLNYVKGVPTGGGHFGTIAGDALPGQINGIVRKKTLRYPDARPWLRMPFIPSSFYTGGSTLTPTGRTAIDTIAATMNHHVSAGLITFLPASYSRISGNMELITGTKSVYSTARIMRRSSFRSKNGGVHINPNVWLY